MGIFFLYHLWPICPRAEILFLLFLNLYPTWVQVVFEISIAEFIPKLGTSEIPDTVPFANLARSYLVQSLHEVSEDIFQLELLRKLSRSLFYSRRVVGDFTSRQFVGKLFCNFRPTWSKVIRRNTNWQAGQGGTTLLILQISLWNNLRKIACRANIPVTLRTISVILAAQFFNRFRKRTSSQIETKFFFVM